MLPVPGNATAYGRKGEGRVRAVTADVVSWHRMRRPLPARRGRPPGHATDRVMAQIRGPARVRTNSPLAWATGALALRQVQAEGGLSVGPSGNQLEAPSSPEDHGCTEVRDQLPAVVLERDRGHGELGGIGGMVSSASSVSRATTPATSPTTKALVKRSTRASSAADRGRGAGSR